MRELASIQRISKLEDIPGACRVQVATILGWHVVVPINTFKVGDKVVYIEVDSILPDSPDHPEFEFMRQRKFKVRTIKLRGQISQGIAFPLTILKGNTGYKEGQDVTEELKITKYEDPKELENPSRYAPRYKWIPKWLVNVLVYLIGLDYTTKLLFICIGQNFPDFIPKTDETRVQVLQPLLDKYAGLDGYVTEKIDGKSATLYINNGIFGVCSRDLDIKRRIGNIFWDTAIYEDIEYKMLSVFIPGRNIAIQGELMGPGIRGNKLKLSRPQFFFYSVFDIDAQCYLNFDNFVRVINSELSLQTVPILEYKLRIHRSIDEWVRLSQGKSVINPEVEREGIVVRPIIETTELEVCRAKLSRDRVSFKVINPKFLLKFED